MQAKTWHKEREQQRRGWFLTPLHDTLSLRPVLPHPYIIQGKASGSRIFRRSLGQGWEGGEGGLTIVSSPRVRSIRKKMIAQNGERGSLVKASG
jgi:hypothetical protein